MIDRAVGTVNIRHTHSGRAGHLAVDDAMADPFIGEIRLFPYRAPLLGWLPCDGRILKNEDYVALFGVIGITYGSAGPEHFHLPDLRGRVPLHRNAAPALNTALSASAMGEQGGVDVVPLDAVNLPAHSHALHVSPAHGTAKTFGGFYAAAPSGTKLYGPPKDLIALAGDSVTTTGHAPIPAPHPTGAPAQGIEVGHAYLRENLQAYVAAPYCICATAGVYPNPGD